MFAGATSFNQNLSKWDVSNGNTFEFMFIGASSFDQRLCWHLNTSEEIATNDMFGSGLEASDGCIDTTCGTAPVTVPPITCS
jgi:surface protein